MVARKTHIIPTTISYQQSLLHDTNRMVVHAPVSVQRNTGNFRLCSDTSDSGYCVAFEADHEVCRKKGYRLQSPPREGVNVNILRN